MCTGIVNVLGCALYSGAECEFAYPFDASNIWNRLASNDFSLFMAVPTIYHKLIQQYESMSPAEQQQMKHACDELRLMVSGSAALPPAVMDRWEEISGHKLLERLHTAAAAVGIAAPCCCY